MPGPDAIITSHLQTVPVDACEQLAVLVQQVETAVSVHQSAHAVEHAVFLVAGANACGSETDAVLQRADARLGVGSVGLGCVRRGLRGLGLGLGCELHVQTVVVLGDLRRDLLRDAALGGVSARDGARDALIARGDIGFRGQTGTIGTFIVLDNTECDGFGILIVCCYSSFGHTVATVRLGTARRSRCACW